MKVISISSLFWLCFLSVGLHPLRATSIALDTIPTELEFDADSGRFSSSSGSYSLRLPPNIRPKPGANSNPDYNVTIV